MIKETITYTDYDGNKRTEDFYFNLTKAELTEMEMSVAGGLSSILEDVINKQDTPTIMAHFKKVILQAYGEKSPDGRRFIKSQKLSEEFSQTEAYSELYMKLVTNADIAAKFINSLMPKDWVREAERRKLLDGLKITPTSDINTSDMNTDQPRDIDVSDMPAIPSTIDTEIDHDA